MASAGLENGVNFPHRIDVPPMVAYPAPVGLWISSRTFCEVDGRNGSRPQPELSGQPLHPCEYPSGSLIALRVQKAVTYLETT
jgi:hypothetical protein